MSIPGGIREEKTDEENLIGGDEQRTDGQRG
jgi:hypothetical protein